MHHNAILLIVTIIKVKYEIVPIRYKLGGDMSSANLLTAASDIQRALTPRPNQSNISKDKALKPDFGEFEKDMLSISSLAQEKLQKEKQIQTNQEIDNIANEVIRISSSIGKARSTGGLTSSQATELYNKIASLL